MSSLVIPRRKFLVGLGALIAAPAIVRAQSLMSVRQMLWTASDWHHYAVVRSGGAVKFFLNGQLTDTDEMPIVPRVVNDRLDISLNNYPLIDEVKMTERLPNGDFTIDFWAKKGR